MEEEEGDRWNFLFEGSSCVRQLRMEVRGGVKRWNTSSKPWMFELGVEGRDGCAKRKEMCGVSVITLVAPL